MHGCSYRLAAWMLLAAFSGGGCATVGVRASVLEPAQVPVQTFPYIAIVQAEGPEEEFIQLQMVETLSEGRSELRVVSEAEVNRPGFASTLGAPLVVVATRLRVEEGFEDRWGHRLGRPVIQGASLPIRRGRNDGWAFVEGRLRVLVTEGATSERFQEFEVQAREEGGDFELMRRIVVARLAREIGLAMTPNRRELRVRLVRLDVDGNEMAIEAAERGDWAEARHQWEEIERRLGSESLGAEEEAGLLYNLGMARLFGAPDSPESLRLAARALRRALALDRQRRYYSALEQVRRQRQRLRHFRSQEAARLRNFQLREEGRPRPDRVRVPDAYLRGERQESR